MGLKAASKCAAFNISLLLTPFIIDDDSCKCYHISAVSELPEVLLKLTQECVKTCR